MNFIHKVVEIHPSSGYNSTMIQRNIFNKLLEALTDTPVVLVTGARQTGKSTLVKHIHEKGINRKYITLDDLTTLNAALYDPEGFIKGLEGPVIIDEIQRAPELLFPIKVAIDTNRQPGRFILTGSANILLLPKVSESLTGRIEILPLYPFAQSELMGVSQSIADILYDSTLLKAFMSVPPAPSPELLKQTITKGGYPEIQTRIVPSRQRAWFNSYITTLVERDIREFANIENSREITRLLSLLAAHSGGLSHYAELSRVLEVPQTTLKRYATLLRAAHLVQIIPAWSKNLGKRVVRSPKLILNDTGLISYLLGINNERLENDPVLYGRLFECFSILEIIKQCSWSETGASCHHFRTSTGQEVDLVLEYPNGDIIGIEMKARAAVTANDFKWLKVLQELAGSRFVRGVVLYTGDNLISFGENLLAIPIHLLWQKLQ